MAIIMLKLCNLYKLLRYFYFEIVSHEIPSVRHHEFNFCNGKNTLKQHTSDSRLVNPDSSQIQWRKIIKKETQKLMLCYVQHFHCLIYRKFESWNTHVWYEHIHTYIHTQIRTKSSKPEKFYVSVSTGSHNHQVWASHGNDMDHKILRLCRVLYLFRIRYTLEFISESFWHFKFY